MVYIVQLLLHIDWCSVQLLSLLLLCYCSHLVEHPHHHHYPQMPQ